MSNLCILFLGKMNYLFTVAGRGSRFLREGIKVPKPLIKVHGVELLIWSMRSFKFTCQDRVYVASLKSHRVRSSLSPKLSLLFPDINIEWIELDELLPGQLLTAQTALLRADIKGPLVIHNCDSFHDSSNIDYLSSIKDNDGLIPYFSAKGSHWSFVDLQPDGTIISAKEKVKISDHCSIGTYVFADTSKITEELYLYIQSLDVSTSEAYIVPFYDWLIGKGYVFKGCPAACPLIYGTPSELCESLNISLNQLRSENSASHGHVLKTLVVDIDGTLCNSPPNGDYSNCMPVPDMCDALRKANYLGNYIILYTSRNVRTFHGNPGLINKYMLPTLLAWLEKNSIPYDEIYIGKPWGNDVAYIDDKMISFDEFLSDHS
jgi:capsule biosynthesis phosphatase